MKLFFLYFLLVAFVPARRHAFTQEPLPVKFHGKVVTLDSAYEGDLQVSLSGPNPDTIRVEWEKIAPDSSSKTTYWITNHVNNISMVLIENDTFYFRNLADRSDHVKPNCLVKKIFGSEVLGLYQFSGSDGAQGVYVGMFNRDPLYIRDADFSEDNEKMLPFFLYFKSCPKLYKKIRTGAEGYVVKTDNPAECMTTWKKIIDDYNRCVAIH